MCSDDPEILKIDEDAELHGELRKLSAFMNRMTPVWAERWKRIEERLKALEQKEPSHE